MILLQTPRLAVRNFEEADRAAVEAMLSDPDVIRHLHFAQFDADQRRRWFDRLLAEPPPPAGDAGEYAIAEPGGVAAVGWLAFGGEPDDRHLGFALARRCWGRGYMTELVRALLAREFDELGSTRVLAKCRVANPASARVLEKAGMHRAGTSYDQGMGGIWAHRHLYRIDAGEVGRQGHR